MNTRIGDELRSLSGRSVDEGEAGLRRADPEAASRIDVQHGDCANRCSISLGKQHEAAILVSREATVPESNPHIPGAVLCKRGDPVERRQSVGIRVAMERSRGPVPSGDDERRGVPPANPDVAA